MQIPVAAEKMFELRFPAKAERLCLVRSLVKRAVDEAGCSAELGDKLVIALNEACMNVIQHAYGDKSEGDAILELYASDVDIYFRLLDHAAPIDLDKVKPRELDDIRPGGLGVHFIREVMDDCDMGHLEQTAGNYLEMKKNIGNSDKSPGIQLIKNV